VIIKAWEKIFYLDYQIIVKRDYSGIRDVLEDVFWEYNLQGGGAECKSKKLIPVATKT
jgi:hypothetical protein